MLKHCTQCGEAQPNDARFCPRCGNAIAAGSASDDPLIGKVVAERYLLVEKIGQGGSGTIYRAEHTTLRKKVAVKILHAQLSQDDTALERFRREATTVSELDNDHILQVLDFGRAEDKRLFFAMEYLDGETLSKVVEREKQLAIPRVIDVITQTAEALMEAHGLGYIHRDLRPRNVYLITRRGRPDFVKLLDFGLAKLVLPDAEVKQTAMGMTFGDPRYMSPEQAKGDTLDRRADIYSLGAIAFEMLTGAPPFSGSGTFEVLQQALDAPVPKVRDLRADCPEWLDLVAQRALAKKPDDRFSTVVKLLECLREQKAPPPLEPAAPKPAAATKAEPAKPEPAPAKVEAAKPEPAPAAAAAKADSGNKLAAASIAKSIASTPQGPSPKETQALGTTRAPFSSAKNKGKDRDKKQPAREAPRAAAPPTASTSGEMTATAPSEPAPVIVPTVMVEPAPAAESVPMPATPAGVDAPANGHAAAEEKQAPRITPVPMPALGKGEQTGEWFEMGAQSSTSAAPYEDDYDVPKRHRGSMIIWGVAGTLTVIGALVILLLPKPAHKAPSEPPKEEAKQEAKPEAKAEPPAPPAPVATPLPAPTPAAPSPAAAVAPAPTPPPTPAAAPVEKEKPAPPPAPEKAEKVEKVAAKAERTPPPVEEPKPSSHSSREAKTKPATASASASEKPAKVAAAPEAKKRHDGVPEGFRDPFAEPAGKPASASEAGQSEFFVKLGRQKLGSGDLSAAAANFNKAREYDPRSPDAIAGLGEVAFEQGDYNAAAVHLKQALRLSPNRPRYLVLLGQAYYKLGKPKDAVSEYRKALKLDPGNQEAQRSLEVAERKLSQGG
jgi:serine/threonine-protein kinase